MIKTQTKNMRKVEVVTVGAALKDVTMASDQISVINNKKDLTRQKLMAMEYGAKIAVDQVALTYGGGALNVGVGLHNFGLKVAPMVCIGKDWNGQEIYYFLKKEGLETDLVTVDSKHATGFSFVLNAELDHEHVIFTHKGCSTFHRFPNLRHVKTNWYYISSLTMDDWSIQMREIIKQVDRTREDLHPIKIAWNPGSRQLKDFKKLIHFLPKVELLILNKDEAIELALNVFGRRANKTKINNAKYLLDLLKLLRMKNLVITDGKNGAYGHDSQDKYYYERSQAKKVVNTVGAGDAFGSGFLAALIKTNDFGKAMKWGIKNSAAVLSAVGAQTGLLKGRVF